jgi:tetratricopeptide (TPR) repeat protein
MRAALLVLAILVVSATPARPALAADAATEEARRHFLRGQQLFEVARWDEAAAEFEQAYAARNDPTFIYNMAQAYRRKGDAKRALELYKNYLIKAPKSPQRAEVEERIAALQKQVEDAERAARTTAPAPVAAPPPAPAAVPELPAPAPLPAQAPASAPAPAPLPAPPPTAASPPPPFPAAGYAPAPAPMPAYVEAPAPTPPSGSSPGKSLRVGGIVCGATGLALVGAGIFFGVEAEAYAHTVEDGPIFNPNFDDRGKLYEKLQWVGYGVGAALIATGAVLFGFGVSAASSPAVALVPAALPGGAGLSAGGTY